ncbi:MAG: glycosyltransferase family 2 protein [Bacteroidota bacterium]
MDKQPFFSVIILTYNRLAFLKLAIESVVNQRFTDWELLIIDDGSTDGTEAYLASFKENLNIRVIRQKNAGQAASRNVAVKQAYGKYIAFLDDDDYYLPDHLETFWTFIKEKKEPVAFVRSFVHWEKDGEVVDKQVLNTNTKGNPLMYMIHGGSAMYPTCSVLHKEIFEHFSFNEEIKVSIDAECWIRILCKYPLLIVPKYTAVIRQHDGSISAGNKRTYKEYIKTWKLILYYDGIKKLLKERHIERFISKYYTFLVYANLKERSRNNAISALLLSVRYDGRKFFMLETYKLLGKAILGRS